MAQKELELNKTRGEEFWRLIAWTNKNPKLIPENIQGKINNLVGEVAKVMRCPPTARSSGSSSVNYEKAMGDLKKILKKYPKLPKEIKKESDI